MIVTRVEFEKLDSAISILRESVQAGEEEGREALAALLNLMRFVKIEE